MRHALAGSVVLLLTAVSFSAEQTVAFDVASIKRNTSATSLWRYDLQPGGRFVGTSMTLGNLVAVAYGAPFPLAPSDIVGGPDWIRTERFDVVAKAVGNPAQDQLPLMLRTLLADRFKLRVHREPREHELLALVVARNDRRLGPRLRRTDLDCTRKGDAPPDDPKIERASPCRDDNYPGRMTSPSLTMPMLARLLSIWIDSRREVRDETGLTGAFELTLEWTPERTPPVPPDASLEFSRAVAAIDPNGASLFTAVQEQLGLKLEPKTRQVEVLIVDRAEKPVAD
jgi:uncharacterized protein (TIGR03435 family)